MQNAQIINGLKKDGFYEFIANHYWELTKDEIKEIALEFFYATYNRVGEEGLKELQQEAIDELYTRL